MGIKIQTIKDIRSHLATELSGTYADEEIRSLSNIIIRSVMGISRPHQLFLTEHSVKVEQASEIMSICRDLKSGKPIQYIIGQTIFYDCIIRLNHATLIPRPETEELVDLIIHENKGYKGKIIDFGTGSGCIAIAIASKLTGSLITGTDISDEALTIAGENAMLNNVKITFVKDDILNTFTGQFERTGIVVSNPPYVRNSEKRMMNRNVLDFEPHRALFVPDDDPLIYYRGILNKAAKVLDHQGRIYFEINEILGESMSLLLESYGYTDIKIITDINGKERIIKGIKYAV
jgi:release factor glutamine methyltransferase